MTGNSKAKLHRKKRQGRSPGTAEVVAVVAAVAQEHVFVVVSAAADDAAYRLKSCEPLQHRRVDRHRHSRRRRRRRRRRFLRLQQSQIGCFSAPLLESATRQRAPPGPRHGPSSSWPTRPPGPAPSRLCPPELKVRTSAHTKNLGWYLDFESRVTHRASGPPPFPQRWTGNSANRACWHKHGGRQRGNMDADLCSLCVHVCVSCVRLCSLMWRRSIRILSVSCICSESTNGHAVLTRRSCVCISCTSLRVPCCRGTAGLRRPRPAQPRARPCGSCKLQPVFHHSAIGAAAR